MALNTLVDKDGICLRSKDFRKGEPLSETQKKLVLPTPKAVPEATIKSDFGVEHWCMI